MNRRMIFQNDPFFELRIDGHAVKPLFYWRVSAVDELSIGARRPRDLNGQEVLREKGDAFRTKNVGHGRNSRIKSKK